VGGTNLIQEFEAGRKECDLPKMCCQSAKTINHGIQLCGHAPDVARSAESLASALRLRDNASAAKILENCRGSFWGWFSYQEYLWVFGDRWGSYPIFQGKTKSGAEILFSSFHEALNLLDLSTTPFLMAVYLTFGYIPGGDTFFENTRTLPPGCLIEFGPNGEIKTDYFTFPQDDRLEISAVEARKELGVRLMTSVARALDGVDEVLVPLSGGIDSRCLLAAALECLPAKRIHTFTYGFPGSFDYELSQEVARLAGVDQSLYPLSIEDYTVKSVNDLALDCGGQIFFLPQTTLESFQAEARLGLPILDGFPGGMLAGSRISTDILAETNVQNLPHFILDRNVWISPADALSCLKGEFISEHEFRNTLLNRYINDTQESLSSDTVAQFERWDYLNRQRKYILFCISKLRHIQNYIFPYLDFDFSDFMFALPINDRLKGAAYYDSLKNLFPKFFEIPTSRSFGGKLKNYPPTRPVKALNAFKFWIKYVLMQGKLSPYIYVKYLPFHKYYNESWELIHYLKNQRNCLSLLNFNRFEDDMKIIRARNLFADRRYPEVNRASAFVNLAMMLLLTKENN
jgi:hypothetical protein